MRKSLALIGVVAILAVAAASIAVFAAEPMPGLGSAADVNPNGCVDCHKKTADGKDYSLPAEIKNLKKHPKASDSMLSTLKGCYTCHAKRADLGGLMHAAHLTGKDNSFIKAYDGSCTHCHSVNAATGAISIKGK
ncbi:MAG: hypothetical protein VB144_01160 [Clostridia bacterium]|nr:hypothetical protein [Clostridia bacterium]